MGKMFLGFLITFLIVILLSCGLMLKNLEATINIENGNATKWAMVITVNGESKIVDGGATETWTVSWKGNSADITVVNVIAEYVAQGGIYETSFNIYDDETKLLIIANCPGHTS